MTDLQTVVDDLTLIRNHANVQECMPGECKVTAGVRHTRPHKHTTYTSTPALLRSMQDAITASIGGTSRGRSLAFERNVLDTDALEQAMKISSAIEDWCHIVDARFNRRDLSASLIAWHAAWDALHPGDAETGFYVAELRGWSGFIMSKVNRSEHTNLELPCPVCGVTRYTKGDGDEDSWPIKITWQRGDLKRTAKAKCAACGAEWASWGAIEELRDEYAETGQLDEAAHAKAVLIGAALTDPDVCTEGVTRKDEFQPCGKPAVALRYDPEERVPYPVCGFHARADMVPLIDLVRAVKGHAA